MFTNVSSYKQSNTPYNPYIYIYIYNSNIIRLIMSMSIIMLLVRSKILVTFCCICQLCVHRSPEVGIGEIPTYITIKQKKANNQL